MLRGRPGRLGTTTGTHLRRRTAVASRSSATSPANDVHNALPPVSDGALALASPDAALGFALPLSALLRARLIVADYVALTKPGIMTLLTTTLCAMLIAARGLPPFWLVAVTMLGGVLAAGGANVAELLHRPRHRRSDVADAQSRHRGRPGQRRSRADIRHTLTVAAVLLLGVMVNWTAAALALAGNLFYVFVYTRWLKRTTPVQHRHRRCGRRGAAARRLGGGDRQPDPAGLGLFAVIFAWTPPHFWALALLNRANTPEHPCRCCRSCRGEAETRRQIVLYTIVLVAALHGAHSAWPGGRSISVRRWSSTGSFSGSRCAFMKRRQTVRSPMFFFSLWFLALLFAAAVVDRIVIS